VREVGGRKNVMAIYAAINTIKRQMELVDRDSFAWDKLRCHLKCLYSLAEHSGVELPPPAWNSDIQLPAIGARKFSL
jgi:hypothetical protein